MQSINDSSARLTGQVRTQAKMPTPGTYASHIGCVTSTAVYWKNSGIRHKFFQPEQVHPPANNSNYMVHLERSDLPGASIDPTKNKENGRMGVVGHRREMQSTPQPNAIAKHSGRDGDGSVAPSLKPHRTACVPLARREVSLKMCIHVFLCRRHGLYNATCNK